MDRIVSPWLFASQETERVVMVNKHALRVFQRIGLVPPDQGPFDPVALAAQLANSGLSAGERIEVKSHLRDCGLLPRGKAINSFRP
ncbi:MAG: hypothetical protein P4L90_10200 [Rhodopila sp.]|nr:hypothetical protein [Rhodopila sp.]